MNREQLIQFLERNIKELGDREYSIRFQSLDDVSLNELTELFRYLSSRIDYSGERTSNISNRCTYICLERRSNPDNMLEQRILCRFDSGEEQLCHYLNDGDAKHLCDHYHVER